MDAGELDPVDRDAVIRTALTEARSNDPAGWGAVANVVKNRLSTGKFGSTPAAIVTAPNQFEVWSNGRAQKVDPRSPEYEAAGHVVDAVAKAAVPDNTSGATHFYSPSGQAALGRSAPAWAKSPTANVGGQLFYAPQGAVKYQDASAAPSKAQPKAAPSAFDTMMGDDGTASPKAATAAPTASAAPSAASPFDEMMGIAAPAPSKAVPAPVSTAPVKGGDGAAAVGQGLINGVPVVGPALLGGANRLAAGVRSLQNNTKFSDELANVQKFGQTTAADHPMADTAGQIGGAVVGMAPLAVAAPGALGLQGASLLARVGAGAGSNALLGAADAGARGQSPIVGGGFGALGGAAGPVAGRVLGGGVNKLVSAAQGALPTGIPGIGRSSANLINSVVNADDPAAVAAFLKLHGPTAMLADAGPSTTGLASALALKPSEAKTIVQNALTERAGGANDRIAAQIDASLGPREDPGVVSKAIADLRSQTGKAYDAVHANSPPVDVKPVVDQIDHLIETSTGNQRTALQNLRNKELVARPASIDPETGAITPETYTTNSQTLHNVRKDLDGMINQGKPGLGVEQGAVAGKQGALQSVRGTLDDVLKTQVPGMAEADKASAALAARQSAVERGYNDVLGAAGPHPETFAADRASQPVGVNVAENKGIRGRIDRMFGTGTQRDAVTLNKLLSGGEDGYATANLRTAFGHDNVSALTDTLAREKAFANTTNEVVQNSATARRTAANKLLEESQPGSLSLLPATASGAVLQAGKSMLYDPLMRMIMESPNAPRNLEVARILTAQGATRDQIFAQLQRLNGAKQGISSVGNALQQAMSGGANRLLIAGGDTNRPN